MAPQERDVGRRLGGVTFGLATPSIATVALIGAIPMTLVVVRMAVFGIETRQRRLEEITAAQLGMSA